MSVAGLTQEWTSGRKNRLGAVRCPPVHHHKMFAMGKNHIPVMRPRGVRSEYLVPRIQAISQKGIFSNGGPQVVELEKRIAEWLGVESSQVVATSNATVALSAAAAISPADKWQVPGWAFPAPALAVLSAGCAMEFVDLDQQTWTVRDERTLGSSGLINVIPFGGSFGQESWAYPGELIVDAAASLATRPKGLQNLPDSAAVVFSLHATKTLGAAEGGVIVFGSRERALTGRS